MLLVNSLIVAAIAAVVEAAPTAKTATIPLTHVSSVTNITNIVLRGRQRLAAINKGHSSRAAPLANGQATNDEVNYQAPISIGGQIRNLLVDTGSSNTWCGARSSCEPTSNGRSTGGNVQVSYGSGSFTGVEYTDKVTYAGLTVARQSIGAASSSTGFPVADGIIGFGPVGLTYLTVDNAYIVPTFMNNLYTEGAIANEVLGVYFKPENGSDTNDNNGELTLGGVDTAKYTGPLTYFPTLSDGSTASNYWGIYIASIKYGNTAIYGAADAIVDTGTTLIYIPTDAYNAFLKASGGTADSTSHLVIFNKAPTQNFIITFSSTAYTLTPAQYLVPAAQYGPFGLNKTKYYAWFADGGDPDNGGVACTIGQKFLENYYSVYDTTNDRIGFAKRT